MALYPAPRPARRRQLAATIQQLTVSFSRSLRAGNKSPATIETYTSAVVLFDGYLTAHHLPHLAADITRELVEDFLADLLRHWKPATAHNRHEGLQQFFRWCR